MVRYSMAIPQDLMARIRKYAESNSIPIASVFKMAITRFLNDEEKKG